MQTNNKGEWSEFWVFAQSAVNPTIPLCNSDLTPIPNKSLHILKIFREGSIFTVNDSKSIKVIKPDSTSSSINKKSLESDLNGFLQNLMSSKGSFSSPHAERLLEIFGQTKAKAPSTDKKDISVEILDPKTLVIANAGFSIKSQMGGPATLLNASKQNTNFRFLVSGFKGDINAVNSITQGNKLQLRIQKIQELCGQFKFEKCQGKVFTQNLRKIDSQMPQLLGCATLANGMQTSANKSWDKLFNTPEFRSLVSDLPIPLTSEEVCFKFKDLILETALGMVPKATWSGIPNADGGYLIVKKNADIVCFHVFNFGEFREYLFNNVKFDTPSLSRHLHGSLYNENGKLYFDINTQIRFVA